MLNWSKLEALVTLFVLVLVLGAFILGDFLHNWAVRWYEKRMKKDNKEQ